MATRLEQLEDLARVFQSLANPTRLRIMTLLAKSEMNETALFKKLKLSQSSVSGQLRLLRLGGLLVSRRDGLYIFYSLADLSRHRLGRKSELTKAGSNAAKFGPAELILPAK